MEKLSYSLGLSIAGNLQKSGVAELNYESFARGVKHHLEASQPEVSPEEANQIINEFFTKLQSKQSEADIKAGPNLFSTIMV